RIAEEVGYADPLYFTRLFTRETGISPREFRKL
ncbi:MAG: Helix-turn-helix domain, partial [Paenibacillus sp.]|nr:Helix-turn-helix domain [Paenibacillus sp.]